MHIITGDSKVAIFANLAYRIKKIWKNHILSKSDAYRWIADKFCLTAKEAHIGEFDLYMCEQLICESMKILRNNHIPLRAAS